MTAKKKTTKKAGKKTAKKTPSKSGRTPAKQSVIPGTKPKRDEELETLAADYETKRDERIAWQQQELAAKQDLTAYMQSKKLTTYSDGELEVTLTPKDDTPNVKVKRVESHPEAAE